jgi:hypothetical protein
MSPHERAVLVALVEATGDDSLMDQLADVRVVSGCPCGCPSIHFKEPTGLGLELVAHAAVDDREFLGSLLLFVTDGTLDNLDFAWVTDSPPKEFPPLSAFVAERA